jgi:hypothetical protein
MSTDPAATRQPERQASESAHRHEFLWSMWFQQMQQLAWLAAAGAGAALIFLERAAPGKPRRRAIVAFICFAIASGVTVIAQTSAADSLWMNKAPERIRKVAPGIAYTLLGAGAAGLYMLVTG